MRVAPVPEVIFEINSGPSISFDDVTHEPTAGAPFSCLFVFFVANDFFSESDIGHKKHKKTRKREGVTYCLGSSTFVAD